jgi:hypothetical protein
MFVEVESNPNCEQSVCARFKDVGGRRAVAQVWSDDRKPDGEWCWVTGWTDDSQDPCCPASAYTVEDSGSGLAHLIVGGLWGIRLKPVSLAEAWDIDSPNQWGQPYLLLANLRDIRYADSVQ